MTNRRSNKVHGLVKFPVNNPDYEDSCEGGLAVYAVFMETPKKKVCIEGFFAKFYGDVIQDDWVEQEKRRRTDRLLEDIKRDSLWFSKQSLRAAVIRKKTGKEKRLYSEDSIFSDAVGNELVLEDCSCARIKLSPRIWQKILHEERRYDILSLPIAGIVYLGSTDASLYHNKRGEMFTASRKDLMPEGLKLVETLETLYRQKAKFVTILDT